MELEHYLQSVASRNDMPPAVERMVLVALTHATVDAGKAVLDDPGALETCAGIRSGDVWRGLKAAELLGYASGVSFNQGDEHLEWALSLPG